MVLSGVRKKIWYFVTKGIMTTPKGILVMMVRRIEERLTTNKVAYLSCSTGCMHFAQTKNVCVNWFISKYIQKCCLHPNTGQTWIFVCNIRLFAGSTFRFEFSKYLQQRSIKW